jgi:hypothetical protein
VAKKKQPKVFARGGEYALAYSPADEVRFTYNGWSEVKPPEPGPATDAPADATADADTTSTNAGKAAKAAPKKATS